MAKEIVFETMREIIEHLFGWEQSREEENFARFFKLEEVRIITADGQDVAWIQEQISEESINLGSFCVAPRCRAGASAHKFYERFWKGPPVLKSMTLAIVKTNPAQQFYEKHGFRTTHEDEHKFYMSAAPMYFFPA